MAKKQYKVDFAYIETDGSTRKEPMTVPLSPFCHVDDEGALVGPWIITGKTYDGPLDDEEVAILKMLPGKEYNPHWRFTVNAK